MSNVVLTIVGLGCCMLGLLCHLRTYGLFRWPRVAETLAKR